MSKRRNVHIVDPPSPNTKKIPRPVRGPHTMPKNALPRDRKGKGKEPAVPQEETSNISRNEHDSFSLPQTFKIIVGSYEKLLYGLEAAFQDGEPGSSVRQLQLKPIFIFPAHVSCVKAVAASPSGGKWLATGSADEIIKVWDLRRRKEIGGLIHHEGKGFLLLLLVTEIYPATRIYHVPHISISIPFTFRIRGWDPLSLPCTRLGCTPYIERPQRSRQLRWCPSFW